MLPKRRKMLNPLLKKPQKNQKRKPKKLKNQRKKKKRHPKKAQKKEPKYQWKKQKRKHKTQDTTAVVSECKEHILTLLHMYSHSDSIAITIFMHRTRCGQWWLFEILSHSIRWLACSEVEVVVYELSFCFHYICRREFEAWLQHEGVVHHFVEGRLICVVWKSFRSRTV